MFIKYQHLLFLNIRLQSIHKKNFIHRDLHSGNILWKNGAKRLNVIWQIGDLGLSQPVNKNSSNNEIYGVIPYIAPEIFKGSVFSKESDIYSIGMIMWELTTGCKPFNDVEHDIDLIYKIIDGKRPEITDDTPECYASLMKKCWDADPLKRPSIEEIYVTVSDWKDYCDVDSYWTGNDDISNEFRQAEVKRYELIQLKKLGPGFNEKPHLKAIFTSRILNPFISKSSTNSTLSFSFTKEQGNNYYF